MTLTEYLIKHNESGEEFAKRTGLHPTTIFRISTGKTIPKKANMLIIIAATNGHVTANDLYGVAPKTRNTREAHEPPAAARSRA